MLLVHIGIASMRQFQCAPTTYVHSMNERFHHKTGFSQTSQLLLIFQCNERVEMNKFLCTWMTIIDSLFYIIDSLSLDVSLELNAKLVVALFVMHKKTCFNHIIMFNTGHYLEIFNNTVSLTHKSFLNRPINPFYLEEARARGYKAFLMLNSTEHEVSTAHKY